MRTSWVSCPCFDVGMAIIFLSLSIRIYVCKIKLRSWQYTKYFVSDVLWCRCISDAVSSVRYCVAVYVFVLVLVGVFGCSFSMILWWCMCHSREFWFFWFFSVPRLSSVLSLECNIFTRAFGLGPNSYKMCLCTWLVLYLTCFMLVTCCFRWLCALSLLFVDFAWCVFCFDSSMLVLIWCFVLPLFAFRVRVLTEHLMEKVDRQAYRMDLISVSIDGGWLCNYGWHPWIGGSSSAILWQRKK